MAGYSFQKKLCLYQKLHNSNKRKVGLPRFEKTWILNGMEMPWYSVFSFLFFFCLEATLGKDTWMRATSATAMVIFSRVLFRKLLDHNYVKVSSQQLGGTLTTEFWRTPDGWRFMDMDQHTCRFFHQDFSKYHETKISEGALKIISREKKYVSALQRTLHQNRWYFTLVIHFFLSLKKTSF